MSLAKGWRDVARHKSGEAQKTNENGKIRAWSYFRPMGERVGPIRCSLGFICVHLRSSAANIRFRFRLGPEEKHIWPQMNADERG